MLSLFTGTERKQKRQTDEIKRGKRMQNAKEMFFTGKFPVVTTPTIKGRRIKRVLGLVSGRSYDSECAFYGLTASAIDIGADAIIGYQENVAFHPDGSKYFSCYGTAITFEPDDPKKRTRRSVMQ
ncbi:hypothetical protein [Desulfovibrio inopinatus]|uniref:hypothetical protein n=1 Tax=Desulfovibrio inopinatus TaxID=102109 RepID=UPI0003FA13A5|nr:hypothetical protein [Desulfovibrio inopinatus]